ncbi:MAG: PD40 domain-containing protein [bacterium]|nr:MAG: PD40 domain-containing protein [bacterium]
MAKKKKKPHAPRTVRELYLYIAIAAVGILVRIPFLGTFDLVTYDGTYYINHARSFFDSAYSPSGFPIGYPAVVALFLPLVRDGVRAAQAVSVLAGLGSLLVFYTLCRQFVERRYALLASLFLALTPLFIRLSTITMSESLYVFCIIAGLLLFVKTKYLYSGLLFGAAAITRPEALGVFGVLVILKIRRPKQLLVLFAGFIALYACNVTAQSLLANRLVLVPKTKLFGTSAEYWKLRETWLEFEGSEQAIDDVRGDREPTTVVTDYMKRLPRELYLLARHISPVLFLLGLFGIVKMRLFLLAAFIPFFIFPPFTFRSEPRFIYPYVPVLLLYSFIGIENIVKGRTRNVFLALAVLSFGAGFVLNWDQITSPVSNGYQWAKRLGRRFDEQIFPGDDIADRKPFFAFYAGGRYIEIPVGPYDETLDHLWESGVEYLVLHAPTIHVIRPKFRPFLYDEAVVRGELRYSQVYFETGVVSMYRRNVHAYPLERRQLVSGSGKYCFGPAWSPDGRRIAYRTIDPSGGGDIHIISVDGGRSERIVVGAGIEDPISWAPDSERIAFSRGIGEHVEICVSHASGDIEPIITEEGKNVSPCWSSDGREVVFCSDRSGGHEIWSKNLETGRLERLTTIGGISYPELSPDGTRIAFIRSGEGLFVLDRQSGAVMRVESPTMVYFKPAWSPDGRFIAVTGKDWGKTDIYLMNADGRNVLLLTKSSVKEGMPAWSPDGESLAAISVTGSGMSINILTGIGPYKDRILNGAQVRVFRPPR